MIRKTGTQLREAARAAKNAFSITRAGGEVVVIEAEDLAALQNETEGWRRLSGSDRDLSAWDQTKMQKVAFYLYRKNHLGRRILTIIEDFVVGDGIQVTAEHEDVKTAIEDFWTDPINAMDKLNGSRVREWQLWGEICIPVTESEGGYTRLGWLDPTYIEGITPDESGQARTIHLTEAGRQALRREDLTAIHWDDAEAGLVGDCFFGKINSTIGARRGISELYTASDWIDALEEVIFSQIDRVRLLNSHIWDVTLHGMNQAAIDTWIKKYGQPPEPGSIRAHNEKVEWKALSPQFGAYEMSRQQKDITDYTLGGLGIPSHWFGSGDDANLATAAVMAEPTRKLLKRKQKEYVGLVTEILAFAIERLRKAGTLKVSDEDAAAFVVTIPDFSGPDVAKVGASIAQLVAAVQSAEDSEYVSKGTARSLVAVVFSELGADINADDEKNKIEDEASERKDKEDEGGRKDEEAEDARNEVLRQAAQAAEDREGVPTE